MVGTFADVVVSDAIVKGIAGFDLELARAALKKDAFETPPQSAGSAFGKGMRVSCSQCGRGGEKGECHFFCG